MKTKTKFLFSGILFLISSISFSQPVWNPAICLVTVDELTASYITVIWDKPLASDIDSFYIYRTDSTNQLFAKISAVSYSDSSYYNDVAVSVNTTWYKYKISAIDLAGTEGALSPWAGNCLLDVVPNFVVGAYTCSWNAYQNASNTPTVLRCMWDSIGAGAMNTQIGNNMPPSWTSWNHTGYSLAANSQYRLEVDMGSACSPTRSIINTSRSNIKNLANPLLLIKTPEQLNYLVKTFPNPNNGEFFLEWNASLQITKIEIIDLTGRIIQTITPLQLQLKKTISLNNNASGIYFVNFYSSNGLISKKITTIP